MVLLSVSNSCRADILCWNITQSAGAYSTLAGVLAGFVVMAMIFSLQDRKDKQSTYTGLFIIGVTFVYGLLATDFINWLSSFNRLSYPIYLSFTMFIYVVSPLFFIAVQLSLPEVKRKGKEVVQLELF